LSSGEKDHTHLVSQEYMRAKAEQIAQRRQRIICEKKIADRDRLLQELHVHQIELELQNEELRQSQAKLEFTHQQYLDLYNEAPIGYASLDDTGLIVRSNHMLASMLGLEKYTLSGKALAEFMLPLDQNIFRSRFNAFVRQPKDKHIDIRFKVGGDTKDNNFFIGRIQGRRINKGIKASAISHWSETILIVISDVTALKKSEERIQYQAYHDMLTGNPNRNFLYDQLEQSLSLAKRQDTFGALLFMDIDRFKTINDSLGHHTGDLLLIEFTKRVRNCIRKEDTLVRMGGDEFVILLTEQHHDNNAMAVIAQRFSENLVEALAEPLIVEDYNFQITLSIGISIFPFDEEDNLNDVLRQADTAMYQAKNEGLGLSRFFQESMQESARLRMTLEAELRLALLDNQFILHYQPEVDTDGQIHALEALIRWQHPYRGIVSPDKFICVAEDTGLITELGNWVIESVAKQIVEWRQLGVVDSTIKFAINISPKQLESTLFCSYIEQILSDYDIDPECLVFEITESLLMPNKKVACETLKHLSKLNITFSVDDFGTGYSSLSTIDNAPVGQLKIDRRFIKDLHWSVETEEPVKDHQYSLVNAILSLGKALSLDVVAEGVETQQQLLVLKHLGCPHLQGFFFSKPVPSYEIPDILPPAQN
jgi:diguanylate cyclase (GGDEF)-like protein/PAS domain S-box-containing protein